MDTAFTNAMTERASLVEEQRQLDERMNDVRQRLEAVDRFLTEWRRYAGITGEDAGDAPNSERRARPNANRRNTNNSGPDTARAIRPKNPDRAVVGDNVAALLNEIGKPMSRNALLAALEQENIVLQGTDPKMVLSTMLWRMRDRFIRIPGKGYWFADRPIAGEADTNDSRSEAAD